MAARVVLLYMCLFQVAFCVEESSKATNNGLLSTLSAGVNIAKQFLGSESVALKVAEFVVSAFQPSNPSVNRFPHRDGYPDHSQDHAGSSENNGDSSFPYDESAHGADSHHSLDPLRHLAQLFGLRTPQMSAVAVNALLFVAQMISTFLSGPQKFSRPPRSEDPTSWILNKKSSMLQNLILIAKNETLPNMIDEMISEHGSDEETSCIRLLICKVTPFIDRMQKIVFKDTGSANAEKTNANESFGAKILQRHLPTAEEVNKFSDVCEDKYPLCKLN